MPKPGTWLPALARLVAASGTSCQRAQSFNSVDGKVTYQGQPLTGALVSFHPEEGNRDPAVGLTKPDGTFEVTTGSASGAAAGKYLVTIICPVPLKNQPKGMSFGGEPETEDRLKGAYANRDKSQIKVEIKDGPNHLPPFDLK